MKFKKLLLTLFIVGFATTQLSVFAANDSVSTTKLLANKYRGANYLGCIQYADELLKENPSNVFALYYKGLSYTQLGKKDEATQSLTQVIILNTNSQLTTYAEKGIACMNNDESCSTENMSELEAFIKSDKFYAQTVQSKVNENRLKRIKDDINKELDTKKKVN